MRVISIVNLKGGVGKTVTAVNLASILAKDYEKQVLVIDADPQANASKFFLKEEPTEGWNTTAGILDGTDPYYENYIYNTEADGLDIIPADISLIECDIASIREGGMGIKRMKDFCEAIAEDDAYDYIIFDCPPSFTAASIAAISASSDVVIPVKIDAWAMNGVRELLAQISGLRKINLSLHVAGILITMWHNSEVITLGDDVLRKSGIPVFKTVIRRTDKVDESTYAGIAVHEWSSRCSAGHDYRSWVQEYLGKELGVGGKNEKA